MKSLSSFCIALSATVLLAAGVPERAHSQQGGLLQSRMSSVAFYHYEKGGAETSAGVRQATGVTSLEVSANLDLLRDNNGRSMLLSVTITPKGKGRGEDITFSGIEVKPDGSYEVNDKGHSIRGKISSSLFLAKALNSGRYEQGISGTYTGPNGLKADFATDAGHGWQGLHDPLSAMMYFDSWKYSAADYTEYPVAFGTRETKDQWNLKHIRRGKSLSPEKETDSSGKETENKETENKETENLYAHLRFYQDRDNNPALKRSVSCTGMSCKLKTKFADIPIFDPGDFLPIDGNGDYNADDVHVVLPHRGIYLTLDSSGNNAIGAPLSFGAWMDRAGFFVAPGGTFVRNNGAKNTARMVVAAGELTGSPPAVNAVWRGSMVGTVLEGDAKDHILRGDAELTFDMSNATLDAHFFNIRDYDSFGAPHMVEDAQGGPKNSLRFANIPVAADGRYVKSYGFRDHISGAFYGEGHAETAGTFERKPNSIIGAFGAKQVTRN